MSEYRQPWQRVTIAGRRCRLQILDPQTAFELEPELVRGFGEHLTMALAAPSQVFGSVWDRALGDHGRSLSECLADPELGPEVAADGLKLLAGLLARAVYELDTDAAWVIEATRRMLLGRLEVEGTIIDEWSDFKMGARGRWRAVAAQVAQTFGPLWTRSPYRLRSKVETYGVPEPKGVPVAVRWADTLAKQGSASSSHEILTVWTPVRMIEIVEATAYAAERERRAMDRAKAASQ